MIFLFSFVMHVYAKDCDKVHWKIARLLLLTHDTKDAIKLSWLFTSYWCFFFGGEGEAGGKAFHWVKIARIRSFSGPYSVRKWGNTGQKISEYRHFSHNVTEKKKKMKVIIVIIIIMTIIANEVFRQDCFSKHEKTDKALRFFYIF